MHIHIYISIYLLRTVNEVINEVANWHIKQGNSFFFVLVQEYILQ